MSIILSSNYQSQSIALQTRKGNDIQNYQSFKLSPWENKQIKVVLRNYPEAKVRNDPTPIYNCHGLTFASRRTAIIDAQEIWNIIKDDNYNQITTDEVLPGDIILYFSDDGDIEHSGVVIIEPNKSDFKIPIIISKWGCGHEFIHSATFCPYSKSNMKYYRITDEIRL